MSIRCRIAVIADASLPPLEAWRVPERKLIRQAFLRLPR